MTPSSPAHRTAWIIGVAGGLGLAAMDRYPGGTPLDATSTRYSVSQNFLSDLGMTAAYNGQPNRIGASLFVVSLLLLVIGMGGQLASITRELSHNPRSRRWARAAALCGVLACIAFTGVAFTPENRLMGLHLSFTVWGWRIVPLIAALLGVASWHTGARRAAATWFVASALLGAYAALGTWGPSPIEPHGLVVQVIAQKVATALVGASILAVPRMMDRSHAVPIG